MNGVSRPASLPFLQQHQELEKRVSEAREARQGLKPIHDFEDVKRIIAIGDLSLFRRHDEQPYQAYLKLTLNYAPSISQLMIERLGWTEPLPADAPSSFTRDTDPSLLILALNDWPYGHDLVHYVLWSRIPMLGEATSPSDWPDVQRRGLTAYYNCGEPSVGAGGGRQGAGRELDAWIAERWPRDRYHGVFFVNPLCVG